MKVANPKRSAKPKAASTNLEFASVPATSADADSALRKVETRRERLASALLAWFGKMARDLPWRRTKDPYSIWVSEIMLQQTRVDTVIPYYARFLTTFPTAMALAEASEDAVLAHWSGLGYYRRARLLHAGAKHVSAALGGTLPTTALALRAIPGIGAYTAGAVASIAYDESTPLVDGNVERVLARLFALGVDMRSTEGKKLAWLLAGRLVPSARAGDFNQSLMELGATVCIPAKAPHCDACPVANLCDARAQGKVAELPVLKKRTEPKDEVRSALVLDVGAGLLLQRAAKGARFEGLWELPQVLGDDPVALAARVGVAVKLLHYACVVEHVLSHRRLLMHVYVATATGYAPAAQATEAGAPLRVVQPSERTTLGQSSLTEKILRAIRADESPSPKVRKSRAAQ